MQYFKEKEVWNLSDVGTDPFVWVDFLFFSFNIHLWEIETEHEQGRGRERGGNRLWSRLQALSCGHRAQHRAWTHRPWDHHLSWSRMVNCNYEKVLPTKFGCSMLLASFLKTSALYQGEEVNTNFNIWCHCLTSSSNNHILTRREIHSLYSHCFFFFFIFTTVKICWILKLLESFCKNLIN